jgi:shikimate O-hydroxycinnamoyltransferase
MSRGEAVELNGAGVPFAEASRPELTVQAIRDDHSLAGPLAPGFSKSRVKRGRAAPMAVALTRLADGCVLSVRCSHACLDGASFYGMVRTWSRLCADRSFEPPVLDQSLLPPVPDRPKAEVVRSATQMGWTKLSLLGVAGVLPAFALGRLSERAAPIRFSAAALGSLRDAARREANRADLGTNDALSAHLSRMCVRLQGHGPGTRCQQVTVLDARERLSTIPPAFAGNAAWVVVSATFDAGDGLGEVATKVHEGLEPFLSKPSPEMLEQVTLGLELMRTRAMMLPYDFAAMQGRRPTVVYVNNFSRMPVYDVDFGDDAHPARPLLAIPHDLPDPVLIWPAPPDVGGVEVYLTGRMARALRGRAPGDDWWAEMTRFDRADSRR